MVYGASELESIACGPSLASEPHIADNPKPKASKQACQYTSSLNAAVCLGLRRHLVGKLCQLSLELEHLEAPYATSAQHTSYRTGKDAAPAAGLTPRGTRQLPICCLEQATT
eukprot:3863717-Rhodomonas_salina.1